MPNKSSLRVSNAPPKPLLIWDGECDICRLWIERWREITEGKVDYATYQEAGVRFPEIPVDQFTRAMAFIKPDGDVFFAADAVYRSLAYRRSRRLLAWSYDRVPGFAGVSETGYGFIARHRNFASAVTRLLWGNDVRRPTYFWARRWFLRALGTIYLIALVSLWVQVDGLVGSDGMSPANQFLPAVRAQIGPDAYSLLPTLCWFGQSDAFLHCLCGSGDPSWWNLTALDYHYWSQPLPTLFGWWADKTPEWFKHFSVAFCFVVEIIVPFFIWAPRRLRLIAAGLLIFLQLAIALTGNYCFFNLLTITLCLLLIDDASIGRALKGQASASLASRELRARNMQSALPRFSTYAAVIVLVVTLPINVWLIFSAFKPLARPPRVLANVYERLEAFRIVNGYGLFRVMTKDRCEIVLEGSTDGIDWLPYEFKWKPGDVKRAPGWCAPHQPRLDWQMWFAALETPQENRWLIALVFRLLQGSRDVSGLLSLNPFPGKPPRYIRAMFYRYRFTTVDERHQIGAWWKREELREYLPALSLDQFR